MHVFMALAVFAASVAVDEKLDEKFLTGMWTIKYVDGKTEDMLNHLDPPVRPQRWRSTHEFSSRPCSG